MTKTLRPRRRRMAAAVAGTALALAAFSVSAPPAAAHDIDCLADIGGGNPLGEGVDYVICSVEAEVHDAEHDVQNAAWIVYCYYEYLNGRPCF